MNKANKMEEVRSNIHSLCVVDANADCSGACKMFTAELKSGEFDMAAEGSAREVCQMHNWCEGPELRSKAETDGVRSHQARVFGTIVDPEIRCKIRNIEVASEGFQAPTSFDSETNWPVCAKVIGDIRDQSNCGCCWAFGGASAASDRMCIATSGADLLSISAQDICFCSNYNGCNGGQTYTPWSYLHDTGAVTGGQFNGTGPLGLGFCSDFSLPHCHHHGPQRDDPYPAEGAPGCPSESSPRCPKKCDSTAKSPHNQMRSDRYGFSGSISGFQDVDALKESIMTFGPTETAFTVYKDFENYSGGIYVKKSWQTLGGHAVRIVGWGEENSIPYWKVANSWNPYWGESGYFRIIAGKDECGIESAAIASGSDAKWKKI